MPRIEHNDIVYGPRWDEDATIEADWAELDNVVYELSCSEDPVDDVLRARVDMQYPSRPDDHWTNYVIHLTAYVIHLTAAEATRVRGIIAEGEACRVHPDVPRCEARQTEHEPARVAVE